MHASCRSSSLLVQNLGASSYHLALGEFAERPLPFWYIFGIIGGKTQRGIHHGIHLSGQQHFGLCQAGGGPVHRRTRRHAGAGTGRPGGATGLRADRAPAGPGGERAHGPGQDPGGRFSALPPDPGAALRKGIPGSPPRLPPGAGRRPAGSAAAGQSRAEDLCN